MCAFYCISFSSLTYLSNSYSVWKVQVPPSQLLPEDSIERFICMQIRLHLFPIVPTHSSCIEKPHIWLLCKKVDIFSPSIVIQIAQCLEKHSKSGVK